MIALFQSLPQEVVFRGERLRVDLAFDKVLACLDAARNQQLSDAARIQLVREKLLPNAKKLSRADAAKLVECVFKELIFFQKPSDAKKQPRSFDFTADADLIYAAFKQAYGLDLFEQQGKLHWWKFISLFVALPQDTKMREVMSIRVREVPAPTKYNAKEISSLLALKQAYALPQNKDGETYTDGLQSLWATLERRAVKR